MVKSLRYSIAFHIKTNSFPPLKKLNMYYYYNNNHFAFNGFNHHIIKIHHNTRVMVDFKIVY